MPNLTVRRYLAACCMVNEKYLYILGGHNSEQLNSIERLNIQESTTE